jgi:hypothetical protein
MSAPALTAGRWERISSFSETFTCYSAAMATWAAAADDDWPAVVNPGLWLTITSPGSEIFGFAYFPHTLRAELGVVRHGAPNAGDAVAGVLAEVGRSGRAIVAGDGFHLPWHVAFERRHVPHWYVLEEAAEGLVMFDAFAARNALGVQEVTRRAVSHADLPELLRALPEDDPVLRLREVLAFGDDTAPLPWHPYQWFERESVDGVAKPEGADGPDGLLLLAGHFREHGQDPAAYRQADDIWSIGRHRAFLARLLGEEAASRGDRELAAWVEEHAAPLAKRWGHVAPLLMQATLALDSGRPASTSVSEVLEDLAGRERSAAQAFPGDRTAVRL